MWELLNTECFQLGMVAGSCITGVCTVIFVWILLWHKG